MRRPIVHQLRCPQTAWVALPFLLVSCGGDGTTPPPPPPEAALLQVSVSSSGEDRDLNGYTVTLDGSQSRAIGGVRQPNTVDFEDPASGSHELELTETTDNCQVTGENPRTVSVSEGETTQTTFEVACTRVEKIGFVRGGEIYVMQSDGQDPFRITDDAANLDMYGWEWSPDGTAIAYTASGAVITLIDATGTGSPNPVTEPQSINPAWSPDGVQIAFQSDRTGDADVWIVNLLGGAGTNLTNDPDAEDLSPAWSPDGSRILFGKGGEIWTMLPNGLNKTAVIEETEFALAGNGEWSPDGGQIAFLGSEDGVTAEIWTVAADGSDLRQLTTDAELGPENQLQWAPDGTRIAFHSERTGDLEIWVVDVDGSNLTNLTTDPGADRDPAWSPDGSQVLFASDRTGFQTIWIMDTDGSNLLRITDELESDGDAAPAWRPSQ